MAGVFSGFVCDVVGQYAAEMANRYRLTEEEFNRLPFGPDWTIRDIPKEEWTKIPNLPRREDTFAVMASGSCSNPILLNSVYSIIGIDVLVHETKPKPGELSGNSYHVVIQHLNDPKHPYLMHGPFTKGTVISHHFGYEDLCVYFSNLDAPPSAQ